MSKSDEDSFIDLFKEIERQAQHDREEIIKSIPRLVNGYRNLEYRDIRTSRGVNLPFNILKPLRKIKRNKNRKTLMLEIVQQFQTFEAFKAKLDSYTVYFTGEEEDFLAGLLMHYPNLSNNFLQLLKYDYDRFPIERFIDWQPSKQEPLDEMGFLYTFSIYDTAEEFKQILDTGIPLSYVYKMALEQN